MLKQKPLPGTDLTNQIIAVLLMFREEYVGVIEATEETEAMFHQVKVPATRCGKWATPVKK